MARAAPGFPEAALVFLWYKINFLLKYPGKKG